MEFSLLPLKNLRVLAFGALAACSGAQPHASEPATKIEPTTSSSEPMVVDSPTSPKTLGEHKATPIVENAPPTLPSGTTVLHVGDSFAGALGLDLNRELQAAGVRSVLKYQTSSYIPTWAWGKELGQHIANYNPDLVLVTLGSNDLEIPDPAARVRAIRRIVSTIGQRPCVWIGPPLWEGAKPALLEVVRAECAPCLYLDSTAHLPNLARARDGIHPSGPARTEWAALVVQWLGERRNPQGTQPWSLSAPSLSTASSASAGR